MLSRLQRLGIDKGVRQALQRPVSLVRYNSTAPRRNGSKPSYERRFKYQQLSEYYRDPTTSSSIPELERSRLVPTMSTFYAGNPAHERRLSKLMDVLNRYLSLPFDKKNASNTWLTFDDYKEIGGGNKLKITQYQKLVTTLKRLDSIDPQLKNTEIEDVLHEYRKAGEQTSSGKKMKTLDEKGRAIALGRRKASSAKVYVVKGEGEVLINGSPLEKVFPIYEDRLRLLYPLQVVNGEHEYNIFALARGGGKTGQIDSIKLAISRALCIHNPLLKKRLFAAGCLTRDHRVVERKKPGKRKARKMPTWVKR